MNRTWIVLWLISGALLVGFALGPGRAAAEQNDAVELMAQADAALTEALRCQHESALANAKAAEARRAAKLENTRESAARSHRAGRDEEQAQRDAASAWEAAGTILDTALPAISPHDPSMRDELRRLRNRAWVGMGNVAGAAKDLEAMLDESVEAAECDAEALVRMREDLATAYYHGARLMRQRGDPENRWRPVSDRARQHARVLAERTDPNSAEHAGQPHHQRNLEIIMDFERRSLDELEFTPLPDDCPGGNCRKLDLDSWPWEQTRRPSSPEDDRDKNPADPDQAGGS